jgi:hypothetical protein
MRRPVIAQFPGFPGFPALASLFSLAGLVSFAGCAGSPPELPPLPDIPSGSYLAVASSDFTSGALHTIDLATLAVRKNVDTLDAQPVVRAYGDKLYALDQTHGAMRVYDVASDFAGPQDYPLGKTPGVPAAQGNPYDIYIDTPRNVAYVTLYGSFGSTTIDGSNALAVVDLAAPAAGISRFIPLPVASGDGDNNPDATRLVGCNDKLYVLLQDLDRSAGYVSVAPGRMAVVNLNNPLDVSIIQLAGKNPTALSLLPGCTEAIVGSAGNQLAGTLTGESGIERVDLVGKKSLGLAITELSFGGNVSTVDAASSHDVVVAISSKEGTGYNNDVFVADAMAGTMGQKLLGPLNFIPQLRVVAGRVVVLSAGTPNANQLKTGLFIGPLDGNTLSMESIDLGQAPVSTDLFVRK